MTEPAKPQSPAPTPDTPAVAAPQAAEAAAAPPKAIALVTPPRDTPAAAVAPAPSVTPPPPNPAVKVAPPSQTPQPVAAAPAKPAAPAPNPAPAAAKPAPPAAPVAPAVKMHPVAGPAKLKRRHYGLMLSFVALVVVPCLIGAFYLFAMAQDQYASRAGFTIRQEDGNSASSILGGLSFLTGASQGVNAGVLHEFMQSQTMMEKVDARVDLREHFSQGWPYDPVYSIWEDATKEELFSFWNRVLRLSYDSASGLIDVQVHALDPDTAQNIAQVILEESQIMINQLNETARRDAMSNADRELDTAVAQLRDAREKLTVFRATTRIVDPVADIQGRLGVVSNLQQQLAQALVEYDMLDPSTRADDPRRALLNRTINVIRNRIEEERNFFGNQDAATEDTYPEMIAQYEGLRVDMEFAERNYTAALAAKQAAISNASRQSLYLAAYIPPTLAEESEYPERFTLLAMIIGFTLLAWSTVALIYYSLRDRG